MTRKELLKTAKPMLFSTDMVRAILDGSKTQTRRVIKPQPKYSIKQKAISGRWHEYSVKPYVEIIYQSPWGNEFIPKYKVGDILYVRETWGEMEQLSTCNKLLVYEADGTISEDSDFAFCGWKSPARMPPKVARIFLRVTGVRAERLQDITAEDCIKEGSYLDKCECYPRAKAHNDRVFDKLCKQTWCFEHGYEFKYLWDSIYAKHDSGIYAWDKNPFVWVYEFARVEITE